VDPAPPPRSPRRPSPILVSITALLLVGYFGILGWAWLEPTNDPQHGMAEGFLAMVTFFFLCLAGALWYGASRERAGCVWAVFAVCALPSLSLVGRGIYLLVQWMKHAP
jgi:hypothetical protein